MRRDLRRDFLVIPGHEMLSAIRQYIAFRDALRDSFRDVREGAAAGPSVMVPPIIDVPGHVLAALRERGKPYVGIERPKGFRRQYRGQAMLSQR